MKKNTLFITAIGVFCLFNPWLQGSQRNSMPERFEKIKFPIYLHTLHSLRRENSNKLINQRYGIEAGEFWQLPFGYQEQIRRMRTFSNIENLKNILQFLRTFSQTMPSYKHYAIEKIFFTAIHFIIQNSDIRYNRKIQQLLENIENEFQEVEEFVVTKSSYSFFRGVMPWHDGPVGDAIEAEDRDTLKEVLKTCLIPDFIHNISSSGTNDIFAIHRQNAQQNGVWDDEINDLFQAVLGKYSHVSKND
ncbi:MAG: hypothetical protein LBS71_01510 [Puniceicoccales bacterium]|jgi:hypothetical protein|nr:hypothetical protein [Puniceicoccales bacterium]